MFCSKCGKQIDDDSRFCPFCGNTAEGSPVPKASGGLAKSREQAAGRQRAKGPLPVKLIAGGAAAALALLTVCIILFRPAGGRLIEDSLLGRIFSMSWGDISGMSAKDFKKLFEEEDISCMYEEGSRSDWMLATKETSRFMGGDAIYGIESDAGAYTQAFILLYETRDECKDSYKKIRSYLNDNAAKNTTAVDLQSIVSERQSVQTPHVTVLEELMIPIPVEGSQNIQAPILQKPAPKIRRSFKSKFLNQGRRVFSNLMMCAHVIESWEVRDCYGYLLDKSSKQEDLKKYLEYSLKKAEMNGKELSSEEEEALRKEIEEGAVCKNIVVMRGVVDDMSNLSKGLGIDGEEYSKEICLLAVQYELKKETEVTSDFAFLGWDALSGREIDIEKAKDSLDEDFRRYIEKEIRGMDESSIFGSITDEDKDDMVKFLYYTIHMMDEHNYDMLDGKYIDKKDRNLWYIINLQYDMDKGEAVELSEYADPIGVYCAVEYNYDIRNGEKFTNDSDKEIYLASMGYDMDAGREIDLSDYMYSGEIYCAVKYNYNVEESDYFASDLERALYLEEKWDYNMDTGAIFGNADVKRLWFLLRYGYDINSGETVGRYANIDKEAAEALTAYQEYIIDRQLLGSDYNIIFIDEDNIPEICIEYNSYGILLLTYHNGAVNERGSGNGERFDYVEKKNFYCWSGGMFGYFHDDFYKLENGEETLIVSGSYEKSNWEVESYRWNEVECTEDEYDNSIKALISSYVGDAEWSSFKYRGYDLLSAIDAAIDAGAL